MNPVALKGLTLCTFCSNWTQLNSKTCFTSSLSFLPDSRGVWTIIFLPLHSFLPPEFETQALRKNFHLLSLSPSWAKRAIRGTAGWIWNYGTCCLTCSHVTSSPPLFLWTFPIAHSSVWLASMSLGWKRNGPVYSVPNGEGRNLLAVALILKVWATKITAPSIPRIR